MDIIINADDFGFNQRCTDAICESFAKGLITDTTMMANGSAFDYALNKMKSNHLEKRVGIHFNLTEGEPLTEEIRKTELFTENGKFRGSISRLRPLTYEEAKAVYHELDAQVGRLKKHGISITHADSHHHIHTAVFVAPIVLKVCKENGISKIRLHRNFGRISGLKKIEKTVFNHWLRANGFITTEFFGSMKDVESSGLVSQLEIMVHPDYNAESILIDRVRYNGGCAVGNPLSELKSTETIMFRTYKDLS